MEEKKAMTADKDLSRLFEMLKENIPIPDEHAKEGILNVFTYILSM